MRLQIIALLCASVSLLSAAFAGAKDGTLPLEKLALPDGFKIASYKQPKTASLPGSK